MKYFIKRKSKLLEKAALGSAFFMVSAFAMFSNHMNAEPFKSDLKLANQSDSLFSARKVFENIESSALEILPKSTRLDMLDYWDVDSIYKASNAMEGLSWIEFVSPTYLKVRVTNVSSYEIKILPSKEGKIIMTINTVGDDSQAQDSQIRFYDENLRELTTAKHLTMPQLKDFFDIPKGSATKMKEIEEMIPFPTICFSANPDNDNLQARLTVEKYINEDDWNIAKLFVKPFIDLEWKKDKYIYKK